MSTSIDGSLLVYGGFLLACYDEDTEEYQCICKIGTGFTDVQLQEFSEALKKTVIDKPKNYFRLAVIYLD